MDLLIKEECTMTIEESNNTCDNGTKPPSEHEIIKSKLASGEYKLQKKLKRNKSSPLWEIFALIVDADNERIEGVVACLSCGGIYKYDRCSANLVRHKCFMLARLKIHTGPIAYIDCKPKVLIIEAVTEWTVENCRSINIMHDSGIKKIFELFASVGAKYGHSVTIDQILPQPSILSEKVSNLYKDHSEVVKEEIDNASSVGYAISCSVFTDSILCQTYVSISIHFINELAIVNRVVGIKLLRKETGDNIKKEVVEQLRKFDCALDEDKAVIVTDHGLNMKCAFKDYVQIHCISHLLNDIIDGAFKNIPQLNELLCHCKKLLTHVNKFANDSSLETSFKNCNNIYNTFSLVAKNWDNIPLTIHARNEKDGLTNLNVENVQAIATVLERIEKSLETLTEIDCPTLHLVIPHFHQLQAYFSTDCDKTDLVSQLKQYLVKHIIATKKTYVTQFHRIAIFLFPPTNGLIQCDTNEKETILQACKDLMKKYWTEPCINNDASSSQNVFESFIPTYSQDNIIDSEIMTYKLVKTPFTENFNVLQWWSANKSLFPLLYKVSCRVFSIPASSSWSKRAQSKIRLLNSEKRSRVSYPDEMENEIIFLNSNPRTSN